MITISESIGSKVLLITASHTGNNIFCTPAIKFLKKHYPNTIFDVLAFNKLSAEVFKENPSINKLIVSNKSRVINKLARNYSQVICLHNKAREMISGLNPNFITAPDFIPNVHHAEQILQYVAGSINKEITDEDRAYAIAGKTNSKHLVLDDFNVKSHDILVCMHLGCGRTKTHGWKFFHSSARTHKKLLPIKTYIDLANELVKFNSNIRFVITGTKNENFLAKEFVKNVPNAIDLTAKTSVSELFNLMDKFSLFISQDCGVMHIASASNVSLLGLFGPTNPIMTGPYPVKYNQKIIKEESMSDIKMTEVVVAALKLLNISPKFELLA
ncbi:MAG: glycosyltransferase family 9 protein [Methylophilaceae bacterium]|nr:glycosyltransferase family 9 protein [Methylophilaceae bacterium]